MPEILQAKPANRRRSPRRRPRSAVKVECRRGTSGMGANLVVTVLDVSDSGTRLIVKQALEPRAEVEIILSGYGLKTPIKRIGNVRWQVALENGQFCMGIEFQKHLPYRDWQSLASPN
jgi:hypothetical protein